jgi:hypothetical protein
VVPPFQVPDEAHHVAYTQSIVARGELPGDGPNRLSSEESAAFDAALKGNLLGNTFKKPQWSATADRRLRAIEGRLPGSDGGGPIAQGDNPPLYYLYEAVPYVAGGGASFLDRLHLMRLWSVLLLLATTTGGWLLAGEVFGRDRLLQLAAAALTGLQPMVTFVSAGVNPDAGIFALWTVAFWLGARILRRGLTLRDGLALGLVAGFAVTEKATSWALVPAVLLAFAVGFRRRDAAREPRPRRALLVALAGLALPAGAWIATAAALGRSVTNKAPHVAGVASPSLTSLHSLRRFAGYVWQYYLPKLPFQDPFPGLTAGGSRFYTTWHETGWGAFGLLDVRLPDWTYSLLAIVSAVVILGGVAALLRARRARRADPALVGFLLLAAIALMFTLHWVDYTFLTLENHAVEQGRYVLPLVSLGGLALAGSVSLLPRRARAPAVGVVLGGLVALQLGSLGVTLERFYA